ncbi:MAG: 50S ribosomal protein L3 [Kiritimatiellae bacterium]|nr:50S ribosomal protein L3 [Kiritimatiellia bacterium]
MKALIGRKVGMTRIYDENGVQVPVTVLQVGPCAVVQRKTVASDGYEAVQLGFEDQKPQRLAKAQQKHFEKAGVSAKRVLREVRLDEGEDAKVGDTITASIFEGVAYVDVLAKTKGRGFQGVIRRFRMAGGRETHGGAWTRRPGSIGNREWPARVFKNKRLPGQMGSANVTTQNLRVVKVMPEDNAILLAGAVPGPNGGLVMVRKAIKKA